MVIGLDPTSGSLGAAPKTLAARPASLDGAVVGVVANGLGMGERFFDHLLEELGQEFKIADVIRVKKPSVSVPPNADDWEQLTRRADLVLTGFGG